MIDSLNRFTAASGQSVTATATSTDVIDLSAVKRGEGQVLPIVVNVETAFTSTATDTTMAIALYEGATSTPDTLVATTDAIPKASLVAGYVNRALSIGPGVTKRYVALKFTVAGAANFGAGKLHANIVNSTQSPVT